MQPRVISKGAELQMKPNVIIALLVGGVIGFAVGKMVAGPNANNAAPAIAAANAPAAPGAKGPAPAARPGGDDQTVFKVPLDASPVHGNNGALVTIVEFSDYQCPFCSRANTTIKQVEQDYGDKVRVVMRQFPLSFHQNAKNAALAALAAGEQGKYWEMHEKLFGNQQALDAASLEKYASELGLNLEKFKADMQSPKLADIIGKDQAAGSQVGVTGTPAFFINGRKISGAQPIQNFKTVIDQELAKAQGMVAAGTKPEGLYAAIMDKAQNAPAAAPAAAPAPAVRNVPVPADAPARGANPAKVTIVMWSDFQCPFCSRVEPTVKQILDTYPNDVKVVWRNEPLPFHANAKPAAEAAMAANEQGKFWQMHDKMFSNQQALDRASLERYAQEIGLNMDQFKSALDTGKFRAKVEADAAAGNEVGANGTPTFYINGKQLVGAQPFDAFKQVIDAELANANKLIASGVKVEDVYARAIADGAKAAPAAPAGAPPQAAPPAPAKVVENIDISHAPVKGPKNAPITIVEWSDFQCPFCSRAVPTLTEIEKTYGNKVKVAFKNQPLPFHSNARLAANAAMAANEQGKFWQMHDKLFANQQALDRASIEKYAQEIGLDVNKFKAALDSNKFDAEITKDSQEGMQAGANGTPTFFINGRMLVGAQPVDAFKTIIDEELKKKK